MREPDEGTERDPPACIHDNNRQTRKERRRNMNFRKLIGAALCLSLIHI